MRGIVSKGLGSPRAWCALAILVCAYFLQDPVESKVMAPLSHAANLHMIKDGAMSLQAYAALMLVRLGWNALLVGVVWAALGRPFDGFPINDTRAVRHLVIGLAIGLSVMAAAILVIVAMNDASVSFGSQSDVSAMKFGVGWLLADLVGALGEELYGRAAILLVAERFLGWKGAILVSGVMFFIIHLGNPGASVIWLVRLGIQGMLLAYAVYRTGSLWWSVGYHTGWNWASAPLFGAAGSGYLDQGHLFNFLPHGSALLTGGAVGPEGSILAFVAVVAAFLLLRKTLPVGSIIQRAGS
ncbi:CPBP family intramembrane glutamic endopeptidase [Rhodanobacter koreensis]